MIAMLTPALVSLGALGFLLVLSLVFAETGLLAGFFLPGDSLLFTTGVLVAAHVINLPLWLVLPGLFLAAVAGDQTGYLLGHQVGPRLLRRERRWLPAERVAVAEDFFARHGGRAVILARFVPGARTLVPVVAGVTRMEFRRFVVFNAVGALAWTVLLTIGGYFLGGVAVVAAHVELVAIGIVAASLVPAAFEILRRRRNRRRRDRVASQAPVRVPVGA